jgi:DNA-binding PadR family transcriptional regulator
MTHAHTDPQSLLPLTPLAFEILLSLAEEDRHGYHIMQAVDRRTDGRIALHAGTLYRAIARLVDLGLIEELDERRDPATDERRRYYRLTPFGRSVAEAEATRLESQVRAARALRLLKRGAR